MISRLLPKSSPLRRFSFNFYADSPSISVSRCRSNSNFTLRRSFCSNHHGGSSGEVKYAHFVWEKLYPPEEREDYCSSDVVIEAQSKGLLECMKIIERKGCFSETIGEVESKRLADLLNRDRDP